MTASDNTTKFMTLDAETAKTMTSSVNKASLGMLLNDTGPGSDMAKTTHEGPDEDVSAEDMTLKTTPSNHDTNAMVSRPHATVTEVDRGQVSAAVLPDQNQADGSHNDHDQPLVASARYPSDPGTYTLDESKCDPSHIRRWHAGGRPKQLSKDPAQLVSDKGAKMSKELAKMLREFTKRSPPFYWRVYSNSQAGRRNTVGYSSPHLLLPSARKHLQPLVQNLEDLSEKSAARMIASRLAWMNGVQEEFMSWTRSIHFLISHALLRHEKGQRDVYITFGNAKKLKRTNGDAASFYPAIDLITMFKVMNRLGEQMTSYKEYQKLPAGERADMVEQWFPFNVARKFHASHFTHEFLSFGAMQDMSGAIVHVTLENLVENGLFELFREVVIEGNGTRSELYEHEVALRYLIHYNVKGRPRQWQITEYELRLADQLAKCMMPKGESKAPFRAFVDFLSFRKRPELNPKFAKWVREHYTAHDIEVTLYPDMEKVYINQPDDKQAIKLVREAMRALPNYSRSIPNPVTIGRDYREDDDAKYRYRICKPKVENVALENLFDRVGWEAEDKKEQRYKLTERWVGSSVNNFLTKKEAELSDVCNQIERECEKEARIADGEVMQEEVTDEQDNDDELAHTVDATTSSGDITDKINGASSPITGSKRKAIALDEISDSPRKKLKKTEDQSLVDRTAKHLLNRKTSRAQLAKCHEKFLRAVKPKLIAAVKDKEERSVQALRIVRKVNELYYVPLPGDEAKKRSDEIKHAVAARKRKVALRRRKLEKLEKRLKLTSGSSTSKLAKKTSSKSSPSTSKEKSSIRLHFNGSSDLSNKHRSQPLQLTNSDESVPLSAYTGTNITSGSSAKQAEETVKAPR